MNDFIEIAELCPIYGCQVKFAKHNIGASFSALFGGGGGGGRTTGQSVQQEDIRTPEQLGILNRLISLAQPQIGQAGRVPPSGLGPLGPSQLQQQAFDFAGGLPETLQGPAFGAFEPTQYDPSQFASQVMDPISQFARRGFQQETIPAIMGGLGFQGAARSSGAADILGREGRNLELGLASQFAPMQFGAQQAHLGRQFGAEQAQLGRQAALPGIAGQMGGQLANIGALQRGIPGEQQAFELSRFMQQDPFRNPAINLALQSIGIPTMENLAFQGYRQPGILESIIPGLSYIGGQYLGRPQ